MQTIDHGAFVCHCEHLIRGQVINRLFCASCAHVPQRLTITVRHDGGLLDSVISFVSVYHKHGQKDVLSRNCWGKDKQSKACTGLSIPIREQLLKRMTGPSD